MSGYLERTNEQKLDVLYRQLALLMGEADALDEGTDTAAKIKEVEGKIEKLEAEAANLTRELFVNSLLQPLDAHERAREEMDAIFNM